MPRAWCGFSFTASVLLLGELSELSGFLLCGPEFGLMQAVEDGDDIREIELVQKPLNASPTTHFQFEAATPSGHGYYNPVLLEEVQRSIQLQLLNHMNNFAVYNHLQQQQQQQQQQQTCTWRSDTAVPVFVQQQQQPFYSQQHLGRHSQLFFHCKAPAVAPQNSTIALLQQRFQRLERDKGMRQAKRLHHPNKLAVPAAAIPSYLSTNLQVSSLLDVNNSRKQSSLPCQAENWLQSTRSSEFESYGRSSMNSEEDTHFDRPSTSDFTLSARLRTSDELSCSAYDNMLPCATRSSPRNWNNNPAVKQRGQAMESEEAENEVDTTLHL